MIYIIGLNCRIPCRFKAIPLKKLDMWICTQNNYAEIGYTVKTGSAKYIIFSFSKHVALIKRKDKVYYFSFLNCVA